MDALFKAIEHRGFRVELRKEIGHKYEDETGTCILINGEVIRLRLEESAKRIEIPPTQKELESPWGYIHKYNYVPSNKFTLYIDEWSFGFLPDRTWRDTDKNPLENRLGNFFVELNKLDQRIKAERKEKAEKAELARIEAARRANLKQQKEAELEKVKKLESHMHNWRKSQDIKNYIKEIKGKVAMGSNTEMQEFLLWAETYAEHLDPTTENRIAILDKEGL